MVKLIKRFYFFIMRILRSRFVKWFALPLCVFVFLKGCVYEPYIALNVVRMELPAKNWDDSISKIKMGIVTDIHAGNGMLERWRTKRIVKKLNAEKPDIAFLLGDFVNGFFNISAMPPADLAEILSKIEAPLGIFAVIGNHDFGYGAPSIIKELSKKDIKFLNNQHVEIKVGDKKFYLAGMSYKFSKYYNFKQVLSKIPQDAPTILLMHSPDAFPALPEDVSIIFAGHTHGGQVRLPIVGALTKSHTIQPVNLEYGFMKSPRETPMYVSPGTGTSFMSFRFFMPPQIEIVTLKNAE